MIYKAKNTTRCIESNQKFKSIMNKNGSLNHINTTSNAEHKLKKTLRRNPISHTVVNLEQWNNSEFIRTGQMLPIVAA